MGSTPATSVADDTSTVRGAQALVADLMARRRWIYWVDLGVTWLAALTLLVVGGSQPSWWSVVLVVPLGLLLFRAGTFIHEIQHFRPGEFPSFVVVWNAVFGCAMRIPHPVFDYHLDHHRASTYGTPVDAEYAVFPRPFPPRNYLRMLRWCAITPLLGVLRFTVGTATLLVGGRTRDRFERKLSAFHMDLSREAAPWTPELRRRWLPYELVACAETVALAALVIAGVVPVFTVVYLYLAHVVAVFVNQVRYPLAHRYEPRDGARSFAEQVADSWDHPAASAFFWAPVGMGYHATHHLLPRMPYHALGRAHRRLAASPELGPLIETATGPSSLHGALRALLSDPAPASR